MSRYMPNVGTVAAKVYTYLMAHPGQEISTPDLARATGFAGSLITPCLAACVKHGVVASRNNSPANCRGVRMWMAIPQPPVPAHVRVSPKIKHRQPVDNHYEPGFFTQFITQRPLHTWKAP